MNEKKDFRFSNPGESLDLGTTMERYENNMEAIRIAKSDDDPTEEELQILSKYVGWGDSQVYKEYESRIHPVKELLSPEERQAIKASIINAHFTDLGIVDTMWKFLESLGFGKTNDLRILDPSAGNGHFKSSSPMWAHSAKWMEVEMDIITGAILRKLHPNSDIRVQGFQTIEPKKDFLFDLAITNVPFADVNIYYDKKNVYSLHNYFMIRMSEFLREGGVLALITSRYSLDSSVRNHMKKMQQIGMKLIASFRLPNTAFKKNARTEVVTDVMFFIKDSKDILSWGGPKTEEWTDIRWKNHSYSNSYYSTSYYDTRPDQIIGTIGFGGSMYGRNEYTVNPLEGVNTIERLQLVGSRVIPVGIYKDIIPEVEPGDDGVIGPKIKKVELTELFGPLPPSKEKRERIDRLTTIYKIAKELIAADYGDAKADNNQQRKILNLTYDSYVLDHGHINEQRSMELIKGTPAGMFLQSLEIVILSKGNPTEYRKAAIFFKRTVNSFPSIEKGASIADVYAFVLGSTGGVSISKIAKIAEESEDKVITELKNEIFYDPGLREWVARDEYLSGNVREKLEYAKDIQKLCKFDITENIKELEVILPVWKTYTEYVTALQSRWIPTETLSEFFKYLFDSWRNFDIVRIEDLDKTTVDWPDIYYVYNSQQYGTSEMKATEVIDRILNTQQIVVFTKDAEGNSVKDERATLAAQEKARIIKEKFNEWVYQDFARAAMLETVFNKKFNSHVNRKYDGSRMIFDGLNTSITLHPYQKDGAARIVYSQNTLLSYDVGWGKTFSFLAGIMKSISCGLAKKAMLVVPNHLVEQTVKQVMWAYPLANILFPTPDDMKRVTRPVFMSRIATSDFHIAVVPFSFFKLMPIDDEIIKDNIREKITQLEEIIRLHYSGYNNKFDTRAKKQLEKAKLRLEEKLKAMSEMKKDSVQTMTFDKMGIDMLVTDEFHAYKNVEIATRMQSVAGLQTKGNQTTFDMAMKMDWLQGRGKKTVGSTATPVTNTIGEAYSLMRYFCPEDLKAKGLFYFDAWADMFAVIESAPEMTPDASGFRMNNRFRRFVNVEQLSTMLGGFAEMRRGENEATFSRPDVYGGKMTKVVIPSTDELREYVKVLANRAAAIKAGGITPDKDNMLLITSDGRKAALDMSFVVPKKNLTLAEMPKIKALVDNVYNIWDKSTPTRSTQLIFCDIGIWKPTKEGQDDKEEKPDEVLTESEAKLTKDVYSIIRNALVMRGVPESEIAFSHEAKTPEQRRAREDDMNSGKTRVLIGSTSKMGTGMNVQTRLIAIHHLDAPWRPADIEQRNGRGWRQGNYHKRIAIFVYIIEGSFDGYVWQTLETKMNFIDQLMRGHLHAKEMDDISETVLSFAEIKAAASGNRKIIEFVILTNEKKKLSALQAAFEKDRLQSKRMQIMKLNGVDETQKHLEKAKMLIAFRDLQPDDPFEVIIERKSEDIHITDKTEAGKSLHAAIADKLGGVLNGRVAYGLLGFYRGFEIRLSTSIMNRSGTLYSLGYLDSNLYFNVTESPEGSIQSMINISRALEKTVKSDEEKIVSLKEEYEQMEIESQKSWNLRAQYDEVYKKYDALSEELRKVGENPEDELEKRHETERAMVAESETVVTEIMEYISTCHEMPSYISIFTAIDGNEVTLQTVTMQEEDVTNEVMSDDLKEIQSIIDTLEAEFEAAFSTITVKSRKKKNGKPIETGIQYILF